MQINKTKERRPTSEDIPAQYLDYPASQEDMFPQPDSDLSYYHSVDTLKKVVFITCTDSGLDAPLRSEGNDLRSVSIKLNQYLLSFISYNYSVILSCQENNSV